MVTLYIWDNPEHTGHASLQIGDREYVSFHPMSPANRAGLLYKKFPPRRSSLQEDLGRYGQPVNKAFIELDEDAMIDAYREIGAKTNYCFWSMNCSTLAAKLILIGAGEKAAGRPMVYNKLVSSGFFSQRHHQHRSGRLTEYVLDGWATAIHAVARDLARTGRTRPGQIRVLLEGLFVAGGVVVNHCVWCPGDVLYLATHLKGHPAFAF
jgi:hypothetical protein